MSLSNEWTEQCAVQRGGGCNWMSLSNEWAEQCAESKQYIHVVMCNSCVTEYRESLPGEVTQLAAVEEAREDRAFSRAASLSGNEGSIRGTDMEWGEDRGN